jgi:hypothetical protein
VTIRTLQFEKLDRLFCLEGTECFRALFAAANAPHWAGDWHDGSRGPSVQITVADSQEKI